MFSYYAVVPTSLERLILFVKKKSNYNKCRLKQIDGRHIYACVIGYTSDTAFYVLKLDF